jgi:1-acyl-sn-glycerol-3-phosphate acyltransferase
VVKRLKGGKVVAIFPEGQVTVGSADVGAFKSGAILMANTANVPIVPLYLAPPRKWYHRRVAVLGSPVNVREMCGLRPSVTELDEVSKYLHERENELKEFYYSKYPEARSSEKSTEDA